MLIEEVNCHVTTNYYNNLHVVYYYQLVTRFQKLNVFRMT